MTETNNKPRVGLIQKVRSLWESASLPGRITFVVLLVSYLGVLLSGLDAREPIVADEVVHYYMLVTQAGKLPGPNVDVNIPMPGWIYHRHYPHVFLWHYVGAIIWLVCGKTFWSVQVYQSLFWLQLLMASWALARTVVPKNQWAICLSMVGLASLPMGLLFSVLLFQDIPATAQVVTSFLFLRRRQMFWSLAFMGIAMSMKVTVFVLLPAYFICVLFFYWRAEPHWRLTLRFFVAVIAVVVMCMPMAMALQKMEFKYYPLAAIQEYLPKLRILQNAERIWQRPAVQKVKVHSIKQKNLPAVQVVEKPEICNNPGDLRVAQNWLIYFGGVFWVLTAGGVIGLIISTLKHEKAEGNESWPFWVGLWCLGITAVHMRTAPDARFFLPAFPFLLMGTSLFATKVPGKRFWFPLLLVVALAQSGVVLAKAVSLRHISPAMWDAIEFMKKENAQGYNYFMYPEGHERFMPGITDWYMKRALHDFWRGNNDTRISMLSDHKMRYIIIKKYKISDVDPDTPDLGVYPRAFVDDISKDSRFRKIFENQAVIVFRVPEEAETTGQLEVKKGSSD